MSLEKINRIQGDGQSGSSKDSELSARPAQDTCVHETVERYVTAGRFAPQAEHWSCSECGASFIPCASRPFTLEQHHELCLGVMSGCYPFVDATLQQAIREGVESAKLLGLPVDCRNLEKGGPLFCGGNA